MHPKAGETRQRCGQTGSQRLVWVQVRDEDSVGEAETSSFQRGGRPRELCKQRALSLARERPSTGGSKEVTKGCWKQKRGMLWGQGVQNTLQGLKEDTARRTMENQQLQKGFL